MAVIIVIICVFVIWGAACVAMNKEEKPKEDYPETEAKKKIFCETIKENKINGTNNKA